MQFELQVLNKVRQQVGGGKVVLSLIICEKLQSRLESTLQ